MQTRHLLATFILLQHQRARIFGLKWQPVNCVESDELKSVLEELALPRS
jgi:hypothetical protein